jgi:hypothetical protein
MSAWEAEEDAKYSEAMPMSSRQAVEEDPIRM